MRILALECGSKLCGCLHLDASADANFRKVWYSLAPCKTIKNFAHVWFEPNFKSKKLVIEFFFNGVA